MQHNDAVLEEYITIEKLVHGGQGLATLADGRKAFVWNALPGETVAVRMIKKKRQYIEAVAEEILQSSPDRVEHEEDNYLATSPWQIMTYAAENLQKDTIAEELFAREHVTLPTHAPIKYTDQASHYRNKMEYSFYGDDRGLHLALYRRGTHGKQIVTGSMLAVPAVDVAARALCGELSRLEIRAGDLKSVVIRASQAGTVMASLYVKPKTFPKVELPEGLDGLRVYHSNPKSPASLPTRLLSQQGGALLTDTLLDQSFMYDSDSFFQVNIPIFEQALQDIRTQTVGDPIDMYAGVGSIGLSVATDTVDLIEADAATAAMAQKNAANSQFTSHVVIAPSEHTLDYIVPERPLIVDPPRAGLHKKVIERLRAVQPLQVIYLSCNPATQARDAALLADIYDITYYQAYNFFPRTPHVETLLVFKKR